MKCTNCGAEVNGKFCMKCGTPVSQGQQFSAYQNQQNNQYYAQANNSGSYQNTGYNQPVNQQNNQYYAQANNSGSYQNTGYNQPVNQQNNQYYAQSDSSGSYQSTGYNQYNQPDYSANNTYSEQQFSIPDAKTTVQGNVKKGSSGKTVAFVIAMVLVVITILGIVVCNIYNGVKEGLNEFGLGFEESVDDYSFEIEDDSEIEVYYEKLETYLEDAEVLTDDFGWSYVLDPDDSNKAIIMGLDMIKVSENITSDSYTITMPKSIDGKKVSQIYNLFIFSPYNENAKIKLVIPGSVKIIHKNAITYCDASLTEIVIEEGVETICNYGIYGCDGLKKITVPRSVKNFGLYAIGYTFELDRGRGPVDGVTIVTKKFSTAASYAKKYNINVEYN